MTWGERLAMTGGKSARNYKVELINNHEKNLYSESR